eukprot:GGOE01001300.1.p1 GENE.GGOE01001300.1~~GGOE01001300.1.p1  ORF type:complete len:598 (-),score=100.10 GGOE01001300.1:135-1865(-)
MSRGQWGVHQGYKGGSQNMNAMKEDDAEVQQLFNDKLQVGINFDKYDNIPVEVSPMDPSTPPIAMFQHLQGLHPSVMANIQRAGYQKPTPVQKYGLPVICSGKDLMACAQTGSGKTATFLIPCINRSLWEGVPQHPMHGPPHLRKAYPSTMILSPTRELATQIFDEARKFIFQTNLHAAVVYGGADYKSQFRQLEAGADVLVGTPGRLMDMMERDKISLSNVRTVVLDEADRMLDMGFEKDIRQILTKTDIPRTGHRQTLMFSATFPKSIQQLAADFLSNYIFLTVGRVGSTTDMITQRLLWVEDSRKKSFLLGMMLHRDAGSTLVFVNHKQEAQSLGHFLKQHGISANSIHGDKTQEEREQALWAFKSGQISVLVATDVAARGLDIPNVAHVVQYDIAGSIDDYIHRIGRTGRAGNTGNAISFVNDRNKGICPELVEVLRESNQDIPTWLEGIVRHMGAFNVLNKKASEGNFGGQDIRQDRSYENYTKQNQAFKDFDEEAYRGFNFEAQPPSAQLAKGGRHGSAGGKGFHGRGGPKGAKGGSYNAAPQASFPVDPAIAYMSQQPQADHIDKHRRF